MTSTLTKKHRFDEVLDSQGVFRLVLRAVSHPCQPVCLGGFAGKLYGDYPQLLALAITLLDNEVGFCVCGADALAGEVSSLTLAGQAAPAEADFIFVCDTGRLRAAVEAAKCGTLADPQKSATLVVCDDGEDPREVTLWGPGIDGRATASLSGTARLALQCRDEQYYEYPQGIDFFFVNGDGELFAIPRGIHWEMV